jgi:hypothetical protein
MEAERVMLVKAKYLFTPILQQVKACRSWRDLCYAKTKKEEASGSR